MSELDAKVKKLKKNPEEEHICRWVGCSSPRFSSLASLVTHVSNNHLLQISHMPVTTPAAPIRYSCQWEGCSRFDIEQPSRFALISHCRTHTGEKPYFCPIPECEKHFTRSDALAKHVKGVHDLHQHRDAIGLMKSRAEKGKSEFPADFPLEALTDEKYAKALNRDYELRMPWWYLKKFVDALVSDSHTLHDLYTQPLDTRQHDLAIVRYKRFLANPDDEMIGQDPEGVMTELAAETRRVVPDWVEFPVTRTGITFREVHAAYLKLQGVYATASRLNAIVTRELDAATRERRRLWSLNQILIDANVEAGLPLRGGLDVTRDQLDDVLMTEGIRKDALEQNQPIKGEQSTESGEAERGAEELRRS